MAARGLQYVILEGGVVPPGIHTVDFTVELTDPSVQHQISFYDTNGRELIATEPVAGPTLMTGAFGVGPPQPPGTYTFRCSVYPQMTGSITVQS
jgi:hypothetical protein